MIAVAEIETLPTIGAWSQTALDLPESLTFDSWVEVGRKLRTVEQSVMWWIGDWLRFGERRYGDKYTQAMESTGYSYQQLADAKYVAGAYTISDRSESLPWSVHKVAAPLSALERQDVLSMAQQNNWSRSDVKTEIARRKAGLPSLSIVPASDEPSPPPPAWQPRKFQRLDLLVGCAFQDWFGITEASANLLLILFNAQGEPMTRRVMGIRVDSHRPPGDGALYEAISTLRKAMDTEAIDQNDGCYYLSEVGLAECRLAIRQEARAMESLGLEPDNDA